VKRALPFLIIAGVAFATVATGVGLYRSYQTPPPVASLPQKSAAKPLDGAHVRGVPDARITIEEYGDFQCPPCGQLSEPLNQIEREFSKECRLVFRQFPLVNHAHAKQAAYAAEAAGLQGRFWEMHDILYREQGIWSKVDDPAELFAGYAKVAGLEGARFQKDVAGEIVKARVIADQQRAAELGVKVTPTVFVNGTLVSGPSLNPDGLRTAIQSALKSTPVP